MKCCSDTSPYWSITVSTDVCCGVYTPYGSDLASQSRTAPTCLPITFATAVRREDSAGREGLVGQLERLCMEDLHVERLFVALFPRFSTLSNQIISVRQQLFLGFD